ncbi:MAG: M23 family metallopeptidase, partial [Dermatophilaceae bacterium]
MAGAALGAALVSLVAPAVGRAGEQPAPVRPPTAQFVAAPAAMTQTSLTPVSPGAIDVLLGIKHVGPSPTPAAAEPEHDLADAPNLGSVATVPVDPTSVLASGFVRPVEGPITSRFGPRFHPILQVWKLHTGTDIGAACGTPVKAAKDGSVTSAGIAGGDGNRVVLDHGQGLATTYNHLSSYAAAVGMQVRQGQVIGYVGTTGLSTGCHLHFEDMVNGVLVDTAPYLDLAPAPSVTLPPAVAATSGAAAPVAAAAAPAPAVQAPA